MSDWVGASNDHEEASNHSRQRCEEKNLSVHGVASLFFGSTFFQKVIQTTQGKTSGIPPDIAPPMKESLSQFRENAPAGRTSEL
jgi:hypothetical protein